MTSIRTIEELARHINEHMRSNPPRILVAGDLYHRSNIHWHPELREKLRANLGWGKTRFRNFTLIAHNRALWRNRKSAPRSLLSLSELSRSNPDVLQYLFDHGFVTTNTTSTHARMLIANDKLRPVVHPKRNDDGIQLRSNPRNIFSASRPTKQEKRLVNRYAVEIKKLHKGTVDDFLTAAAKCDYFVRLYSHLVPLLLRELDMCNSKFWKIKRCAEIAYCGGDTRNLPIRRHTLYCISKISPTELKEALRQEIFSRHTTARQIPEILAEFRNKITGTK